MTDRPPDDDRALQVAEALLNFEVDRFREASETFATVWERDLWLSAAGGLASSVGDLLFAEDDLLHAAPVTAAVLDVPRGSFSDRANIRGILWEHSDLSAAAQALEALYREIAERARARREEQRTGATVRHALLTLAVHCELRAAELFAGPQADGRYFFGEPGSSHYRPDLGEPDPSPDGPGSSASPSAASVEVPAPVDVVDVEEEGGYASA